MSRRITRSQTICLMNPSMVEESKSLPGKKRVQKEVVQNTAVQDVDHVPKKTLVSKLRHEEGGFSSGVSNFSQVAHSPFRRSLRSSPKLSPSLVVRDAQPLKLRLRRCTIDTCIGNGKEKKKDSRVQK
ncbi:hypothetical protein Bhyg_05200 [Pseudolycoriella hygida]|uniref:Uncharacterized protein n=1 Tax=Pseudolycoriella hygida TaxID=35572 RepID=A0A9Q0S966_9DIPT|nr:hypothetical protein Bhyg_05200 [Pseudolycoriella hygida]